MTRANNRKKVTLQGLPLSVPMPNTEGAKANPGQKSNINEGNRKKATSQGLPLSVPMPNVETSEESRAFHNPYWNGSPMTSAEQGVNGTDNPTPIFDFSALDDTEFVVHELTRGLSTTDFCAQPTPVKTEPLSVPRELPFGYTFDLLKDD